MRSMTAIIEHNDAYKRKPPKVTDIVRKFSKAPQGCAAKRKLPEDTDVIRKFSEAPYGYGAYKRKLPESDGFFSCDILQFELACAII